MVDYPDALNIRKLAFAFAFGPLALLLLFGMLDVSMSKASKASKTEVLQLSEQSCVTSNVSVQECLTKVEAKK
ncbi:MAG: hypothetical protein KME64_21965 [Scytonematopsis contorta HA4267-MV1]|jgi:hypothetical protein|nr:hypothetical protein [Scytonematopsis contorta HA4267-MV1]